MDTPLPAIYSPRTPVAPLSWASRVGAIGVAIGCAAILSVAVYLQPNPDGVGTHTALGLQRCEFLYRTGIPCPSCGMTTSFAHFVRGNLLASFYVQPMGAVLAFLATASFWIALYMAISGKPALRLIRDVPPGYYVLPLMFFAIAAWGWKIFLHLKGIDGWS